MERELGRWRRFARHRSARKWVNKHRVNKHRDYRGERRRRSQTLAISVEPTMALTRVCLSGSRGQVLTSDFTAAKVCVKDLRIEIDLKPSK